MDTGVVQAVENRNRFITYLQEHLVAAMIIAVLVGLILLGVSFFLFSSKNPWSQIAGYIVANVGVLSLFASTYTLYSERVLRRDFIAEVKASVRGEVAPICVTNEMLKTGFVGAHPCYSEDKLIERISSARRLTIVAMRHEGFFTSQAGKLRSLLLANQLELTVVLPDPRDKELIQGLTRRYTSPETPIQLAESIARVVNHWLLNKVVGGDKSIRSRVHIYLHRRFPTYSAYVFDGQEIWYIPYHTRVDRQNIPVLVLNSHQNGIAKKELLLDIEDLCSSHNQLNGSKLETHG